MKRRQARAARGELTVADLPPLSGPPATPTLGYKPLTPHTGAESGVAGYHKVPVPHGRFRDVASMETLPEPTQEIRDERGRWKRTATGVVWVSE